MHLGAAPLLERHRIFHSRNVEEAHAYAGRAGYCFAFRTQEAPELDVRVNGIYLPRCYIGYVQYGPAVEVVVPTDRQAVGFWLQFPVRGQFEIASRGGSTTGAPGQGVISGPTGHANRSQARSARINLVIAKGVMEGQLGSLLGDSRNRTLEFVPKIDFTAGHGRGFAAHLLTAVSDIEQDGSLLRHPVTASMFEQFMMTALLLSHPHNYSETLQRLDKTIAPRDVRRAIDYIEAHLDTSITIADIVQATGVAGRTLFKHFRAFKGVSPIRYAQNARFHQVRQVLLRAEPEESVTDIAMRLGFAHMGRFSIEYRQRFGESPSQTLKRRRNRS